MKHIVVIPPSAPFKISAGTRSEDRIDGEWIEDHDAPVIPVKGGEIRYGVVRDAKGNVWGRFVYREGK